MNKLLNLENLESSKVFYFFQQISQIPRGSYKEKQISDYLVKFAKDRNLEYYQDEKFNVIIKKEATSGYENSPIVAIQGHIDMVCEKNKDTKHDFSKDPIKLIQEDDFIRADGTTLGADNGIGVSMALTILDSVDLEHPKIEAIFTTCEEVGMDGATFLDGSKLNAKYLLNIDSEKEGIFTVGCAGGLKSTCHIPVEYENIPNEFLTYSIFVTGLKGGHSGIDILKERGNSNIILARTLNILDEEFDFKLCKITGGAKDNAIPREAEAIISFEKNKLKEIKNKIEDILNIYKNELKVTDSNVNIKFEKVDDVIKCFTKKTQRNVIYSILSLPNGVQHMNAEIVGMPESSTNIGVIECDDKEVRIICAVRSSVYSRKVLVFHKLQAVSELAGGFAEYRSEYPGWEYNSNSKLRETCVKIYKDMFNEEPKIDIIHAGLECGIFVEKIKGIDAISFGPNLFNIHTPIEKVSISSVDRTWKFLKQVIKEIK